MACSRRGYACAGVCRDAMQSPERVATRCIGAQVLPNCKLHNTTSLLHKNTHTHTHMLWRPRHTPRRQQRPGVNSAGKDVHGISGLLVRPSNSQQHGTIRRPGAFQKKKKRDTQTVHTRTHARTHAQTHTRARVRRQTQTHTRTNCTAATNPPLHLRPCGGGGGLCRALTTPSRLTHPYQKHFP